MADCLLTDEADQDLLAIARYTDRKWGREQALKYAVLLEAHLAALVRREPVERAAFRHRDDLRVSRCQHHYVFFVRDRGDDLLVLAVLHESMDLEGRFQERLNDLGMDPE